MSLERFWRRLQRAVLRRAQDDRDLDDEIRFHLAREVQLRIESGASLADAQRDALRAFGPVALAKERTRDIWVSTQLEQLLQDFRHGARILVTAPALSATAILLVALVIGGNATVFSVANGILRKPAPGVRSNDLVTLNWADNSGVVEPASSYANYLDIANQSATLRPLLAFRTFARFTLNHERGSHAVSGTLVSRNYFDVLGVGLVKGRGFNEDESQGSAGLPAVISNRVWRDFFAGEADIIGRSISLSGQPATIVGVVEPDFEGTRLGESAGVWIPLVGYSRIAGQESALLNRLDYTVVIGGRLAPGVSLTQAQSELAAIWTRLSAAHPELNHLKVTLVPYSAVAGTGTGIDEMGNRLLAIFAIVTLLTVVIVCANVANLLLARAATRQREMAVRQSLGASRGRLIRLLVAEGLVISSIAALAALGCAWWVSRAVVSIFPLPDGPWATVAMMDFRPDWSVATYALSLAAVSVLAFTSAPAIRTWRVQLTPWLKAGEQGVIRGRSRLSRGLVVMQLAFSMLLLTSAGLAYRSLFVMNRVEPGFDADSLLRVTVNTSGSARTAETNRTLLEEIRERLGEIPGVAAVSYASLPLFRDGGWLGATLRSGSATHDSIAAQRNYVGPDYLRTLGIAPTSGAEFTARQDAASPRVVMVSQNVANALWPGQVALGQRLSISFGSDVQRMDGAPAPAGRAQEAAVLGVMPDGFLSGFRRQYPRFVFLAALQNGIPPGDVAFYVRYRGSLDALSLGISRSLRDLDTRTAIVGVGPVLRVVQGALWPLRTLTTLLTLFAAISLVIAAIGQYAVVAFDMRRRFREVGLRMALGASSRHVLTSVMRESLQLTGIGLAIGFALSLATGQGIRGILYGVTPTDAMTYFGVFSVLSAASLIACYLPARRAASIQPMTALRLD